MWIVVRCCWFVVMGVIILYVEDIGCFFGYFGFVIWVVRR